MIQLLRRFHKPIRNRFMDEFTIDDQQPEAPKKRAKTVSDLESKYSHALEDLNDCIETLKGLEQYGRFQDAVVRRRAIDCLRRIGHWPA